ncbi:Vacuolar protein sorting-associated protein [Wickerhamomyces ciferrii]|uniref:Vacuolar protein sorting-associated protein n=1 Tax=Wickerhamomyces ciferrii (strain ATCC 14091 / BCRC 22168 / CBS 111 / JCM 3599 / NBRC 0793 / NRRL Y-1031 F-60-10) TaxID=1206466 RepID=K0KHG7_WICCF|nr:Vacuolar protein sorting-associated protein [Wickerhamomyces ciferrii]CCH41622.1 Vacuolar protein sorting-associated protein [Wickerhamomyces ciferrii]
MEVANRTHNNNLPHEQNGNGHHNQRHDNHLAPPSDTLDLEIGFESKPNRARSNSKVYRQTLPPPPPPASSSKSSKSSTNGGVVPPPSSTTTANSSSAARNSIDRAPSANSLSSSSSSSPVPSSSSIPLLKRSYSREQYTSILRLSSLNGTFDRKTLNIPTFPDILQLGRPNSSQKAPSIDNGYFDSKVISRNQAALFIKDDQIFIKDSNSSNGTFVNNVKIAKETAIKENDVIDLGIDIDANQMKQQHHRKISCKVEKIFTIPLTNNNNIESILYDLNHSDQIQAEESKEVSPFDAAFFGDVTTDLDDLAMGMNHDFLSGIFVNNNIGTSSNLTISVKILMDLIHQEKMSNLKLQSIERFLENYKIELSRGEQTAKIRQMKRDLDENKRFAERTAFQMKELEEQYEDLSNRLREDKQIIYDKSNRIKELENENINHKKSIARDLETKIDEHERLLNDKQKEIDELKSNKQTLQSNYESNLKTLEEKISTNNDNYSILEKKYEKLLESRDLVQTKSDLINMIFISLAIVIMGLLILNVF